MQIHFGRVFHFVCLARAPPQGLSPWPTPLMLRAPKKHDAEACVEQLERRYLEADLATLSAVNSKVAGTPKSALAEADRFQSQFDLFHWIETQNDAKGCGAKHNHGAESRSQTISRADRQCIPDRRLGCEICLGIVGSKLPHTVGIEAWTVRAR